MNLLAFNTIPNGFGTTYPEKSWVQEVDPEEVREACVGMEEEVRALVDVSRSFVQLTGGGRFYQRESWFIVGVGGGTCIFSLACGGGEPNDNLWPITTLPATRRIECRDCE